MLWWNDWVLTKSLSWKSQILFFILFRKILDKGTFGVISFIWMHFAFKFDNLLLKLTVKLWKLIKSLLLFFKFQFIDFIKILQSCDFFVKGFFLLFQDIKFFLEVFIWSFLFLPNHRLWNVWSYFFL